MFYYVYLIRSFTTFGKIYVGYTTNLEERLKTHNAGDSIYTKADRPWQLVTYLVFTNKQLAMDFEKYLKSHSGRAFSEKRLY